MPETIPDEASSAGRDGRKIRVVVADDESDLRTMVRSTLENDGRFDVVGEAFTGEEAVSLAETLQPDAVVLDLAMPVLDGLRALPLLRENAPDAKVLVLTAFEGNYQIDSALKLGAHDFVLKGLSSGPEIVTKLMKLCADRPGSSEGPSP